MALKKLFAVLLMLLFETAASVDYDDDYEGSGADVDPCWVRLYPRKFAFKAAYQGFSSLIPVFF